jgi:alanine-synthesizing transaminase
VKPILKSEKLNDVCYDIRGPVLELAQRMEEEGHKIIKLNIGNVGVFGFDPPEEIQLDMIRNLSNASAYSDSKGIFAARKAIMQYCQEKGIQGVTLDDIYTGNGVSELIVLAMNALLNNGDEVLVPAPDYPLWTAAVSLSGGTPIHYLCDEAKEWAPDLADLRSKITPRTKAIVMINPNNPTGAIYSKAVLMELTQIAREHGLILFADEIYDKMLYDEEKHVSLASLSSDVVIITFNGLSKNYRSCGYRSGWMVVSGDKSRIKDYVEGLNMLSSMRLCANVPGQYAIQTALGGYQSIDDLVAKGGRLARQRDLAWELITAIPGVSCVKPKSALYLFPKLDPEMYPIEDDQQFIADLLREEKVLMVQGSGFNWVKPDHFRVVFLPHEDVLKDAIGRFARFLERYRQKHGKTLPLHHSLQRHHEADSSWTIRYWNCWWRRFHGSRTQSR